jgi:hypothetical protein
MIRAILAAAALSVLSGAAPGVSAQPSQFAEVPEEENLPELTGKQAAPIDVTGYWVSLVTEDWRFRMLAPARGDYPGLPINSAARQVADRWDPAQDEAAGAACKSYGAPAIMRVPGRVHITWQDDNTLAIETDAGEQTRLIHFSKLDAPAGGPTLQGFSRGVWESLQRFDYGRGLPPLNGSLKVVTTHLEPGYLRKNGVPYSAQATVTEYFDLVNGANGDQYLIVKTIVEDPVYLVQPFITSSNFKKQDSRSGWNPKPCAAR